MGFFCEKHRKVIVKDFVIFPSFIYLELVKKLLGFWPKKNSCYKDLNMRQFFSSKEKWYNGDKNESHGDSKFARQINQIVIQKNENENVVKEELMLLNDAA